MDSSQSPPERQEPSVEAPERSCANCSAPAERKQRWCLECGAELPQPRKPALRSAIGMATTLTVLVGAASAGGYTLLQDGKQAPPPAQTIAQTPPPVTTPPPTPPPADDVPPPEPTPPTLPDSGFGDDLGGSTGGGGGGTGGGPPSPPLDTSIPDLGDDFDTSSPPPPPPADDTELDDDGSVVPDTGGDRDRADRPRRAPRPRLVETNIAFGSTALPYAPYAEGFPDFGDTSRLTDGATSRPWRSPRVEDPTAQPQMGVYVELASAERIRRMVLTTPTPGMSVEIYASRRDNPPDSITDPGWAHLADRTDIGRRTTIPLAGTGRWKYVLVWIRSLAPGTDRAEISEIELVGLAPE